MAIFVGVTLGFLFPIYVIAQSTSPSGGGGGGGGGSNPDFSISVSPTSGTVEQGGYTTATVTVTSIDGYNQTVALTIEGPSCLEDNVLYGLDPQSGTPTFSSNMFLEVASPAPNTYLITINGTGADGTVHSCDYTLTVSVPPPETHEDINSREIGTWYIRMSPNGEPDALGFLSKLLGEGFNPRFRFWQNQAKDYHFLKPELGGQDNRYVDAVDFPYIIFHGHWGFFQLPLTTSFASPAVNIYLENCEWGDVDMEWAFTRPCEMLNESGLGWESSLFDYHLHGITGFHSVSPVWDDFGSTFATYLTDYNMSIKDAWIETGQALNNSGYWVAVYRAYLFNNLTYEIEKDYGDEHLPGYGSGMFYDPSYFGGFMEDYYFWRVYTRAQCIEGGEIVEWW